MAINARHRRHPMTDQQNPVMIVDEEHVIEYIPEYNDYGFFANEGILFENPSSVQVRYADSPQDSLTEVSFLTAPSIGQFSVDYEPSSSASLNKNTGFIRCNPADAGKEILLTYRGLGTINHPHFRLNREFNVPGDMRVQGNLYLRDSTVDFANIIMGLNLNLYWERFSIPLGSYAGNVLTVTASEISNDGEHIIISAHDDMSGGIIYKIPITDIFSDTPHEGYNYAGGHLNKFLKTNNGVIIGARVPSYGPIPSGSNFYMRSTDDGNTWEKINLPSGQIRDISYDNVGNYFYALLNNNTLYRSNNEGETIGSIIQSGFFYEKIQAGGGTLCAIQNNALMIYSLDGGTNFNNSDIYADSGFYEKFSNEHIFKNSTTPSGGLKKITIYNAASMGKIETKNKLLPLDNIRIENAKSDGVLIANVNQGTFSTVEGNIINFTTNKFDSIGLVEQGYPDIVIYSISLNAGVIYAFGDIGGSPIVMYREYNKF